MYTSGSVGVGDVSGGGVKGSTLSLPRRAMPASPKPPAWEEEAGAVGGSGVEGEEADETSGEGRARAAEKEDKTRRVTSASAPCGPS